MIRAVVFDRDNTLLAFNDDATDRLIAQISQIAPDLPPTATTELWAGWQGAWPQHIDEEPRFWQAFGDALIERYQIASDVAPQLCAVFEQYYTCFTPFPDARPCVQSLHAAGLQLGLLTNFELPSIDRTLEHAGIDPRLFAMTLSSATLGAWKPDPRAYLAAAAALDVAPEECAFIDDDLRNVAAARQLGMRAFQIDRARQTHDFDAQILRSLDPLPQLLGALLV